MWNTASIFDNIIHIYILSNNKNISSAKEIWAPKNCCFWTVVLEKTLESPLDCKEIKKILKEISPRIYNGLKTISLTSGAGKSGQPLVKEWN